MGDVWTIRRVVKWISDDLGGRGIPSSRLEADLLVGEALGIERIRLYMDPDRPLLSAELASIRGLVQRRRAHEPVAYILGRREFYGRSFQVSPAVLIPRPDTETLLEAAVAAAGEVPEGDWVELCTGSGALAVSMALEIEGRAGVATDVSPEALAVARANAESHGTLDRLTFLEGDLFAPLAGRAPTPLLVVNPPYVRADVLATLEPDVRDHEPRLALDGGADGLDFYRRLAEAGPAHLVEGGRLLAEVGHDQAGQVSELFDGAGLRVRGTVEDLAGTPRVVIAER